MNHTLRNRWLVDVALLTGFMACFFMDLTGVSLHQWLGVTAGAIAAYHLISHGNWVAAVTRRFFGNTSNQARLYYLIDALILAGFLGMIGTGLIISTWLNLSLTYYAAWRALHILVSIGMLVLVVAKILLHEGWIRSVVKQGFSAQAQPATPAALARVDLASRRAFLTMLGALGAVSVFAAGGSFASLLLSGSGADRQGSNGTTGNTAASGGAAENPVSTGSTDPTTASNGASSSQSSVVTLDNTTTSSAATGSLDTGVSTNTATTSDATASGADANASAASSAGNSTTSCMIRCGRRCAYPGRCRRYTDSNNNGRCDQGECLS